MAEETIVAGDLNVFMLRRLERFAALAASASLEELPSVRRLARHAALSAYRDCVGLGLIEPATAILARTRGRAPLPA